MSHRSRRPRLRITCRLPAHLVPGVALALALLACGVLTQAARAQQLPQNIRASQDPRSFQKEVETYVNAQVERLLGDQPVAISQARDLLWQPVADPAASNEFRDFYAEVVSRRLEQALAANPKPLNKLNVAIVTERVARYTRSPRFMQLATRLVGDANAAVAIWGTKAGKSILPEALATNQRSQFVPGVVEAVRRFPQSGPLAAEAYDTLSLRVNESNVPSAQALGVAVPIAVPAVHEILRLRIARFGGNGPAPDPQAENSVMVFLAHPAVWPLQSRQQQVQSLGLLRDLMQRLMQAAAQGDGQERRELQVLVARVGVAIATAIGANPQVPGAQPLTAALGDVRRIGPATPIATMEQAVQALTAALATSFPDLPPPGGAGGGGARTTRPTQGG